MINFRVEQTQQKGNTTVFVFEPLERGFGHTLGSCLRRVLLSSLEGAAVSSVKISGVSHQFSTIPGVSEDVIEIILNLKKVRLKIFSDKPIKLSLKASGKTKVKALDIDTLGGGEIINPDLYIASLNSPSAKLNIEMTAEKGVGYVISDEKANNEIGVIPIDSIFTPILSVNYKVEPTRVGRNTNYEKLTLEVTTDGTVAAEDALNETASILSNYFKQIVEPQPLEEITATKPLVSEDTLNMSIEELDLPVRITNALKAVDIDTVGKLTNTPKTQLMKAKNLGVQSLNMISEKLLERNLSLSEA